MRIHRNNPIRLFAFLLLFICGGTTLSAQKASPDTDLLKRFERSIAEGKLSEVETPLFEYVRENPASAGGFAIFAKLRFKQGRFDEARSLLRKALSLDPNFTTAKMDLAAVQSELGEVDEARATLLGISVRDIKDNSVRLRLAQSLQDVGECAKALDVISPLPARAANTDALPLRATCYIMLHDRRGIESLVPAGRSLATQDPPLAIKFAEVLIQGGRLNEALELLKLTVVSTPKNVTALLLLVRTEIVLKDIPKAATYLLRAEKIEPHSSELLFVKALFESEQGNFARSVEFFERSLAKNPMDKTVLSRFVIVAIQANQSSKAVAAARSLLNLEPRNLDFLYLDGVSSLQNNDLIHAEMSLKRYTEARPKDPRGCLALGMTYAAHSDRLDEALRQLAYCIITDPNNFEASYQLGLSYKNMGDLAKAAEFLEQAIEHSPNHAFALRDLGAVYLQMGEEAKARPLLEKAVSQNPSDADTHFQLSRLYDLIGERELGKKHLEIFRKLKEGKKEGM